MPDDIFLECTASDELHRLRSCPRIIVSRPMAVGLHPTAEEFAIAFHSARQKDSAGHYRIIESARESILEAHRGRARRFHSDDVTYYDQNRSPIEFLPFGLVLQEPGQFFPSIRVFQSRKELDREIRIGFHEGFFYETLHPKLPDREGEVEIELRFYLSYWTGRAWVRPPEHPDYVIRCILSPVDERPEVEPEPEPRPEPFPRARPEPVTPPPFRFVPIKIPGGRKRFTNVVIWKDEPELPYNIVVTLDPHYKYRSEYEPLFLFNLESDQQPEPWTREKLQIVLRPGPKFSALIGQSDAHGELIKLYQEPQGGVRVSSGDEYEPTYRPAILETGFGPNLLEPLRPPNNVDPVRLYDLKRDNRYVLGLNMSFLSYCIETVGGEFVAMARLSSVSSEDGGIRLKPLAKITLLSQPSDGHLVIWSHQLDAAVVIPPRHLEESEQVTAFPKQNLFHRSGVRNQLRVTDQNIKLKLRNFADEEIDAVIEQSGNRTKRSVPRSRLKEGLDGGEEVEINSGYSTAIAIGPWRGLLNPAHVASCHKEFVSLDIGTSSLTMVVGESPLNLSNAFLSTNEGLKATPLLAAEVGLTVDLSVSKEAKNYIGYYNPLYWEGKVGYTNHLQPFIENRELQAGDILSHHQFALHLPLRPGLGTPKASGAWEYSVFGRGHLIARCVKFDICCGKYVTSYMRQRDLNVFTESVLHRGEHGIAPIEARNVRSEDLMAGLILMLLDPVRKWLHDKCSKSEKAKSDPECAKLAEMLARMVAPGENNLVVAVTHPASISSAAQLRYRKAVEDAFLSARKIHMQERSGAGSRFGVVMPRLVSEGLAVAYCLWDKMEKPDRPSADAPHTKLVVFDVGAGTLDVTVVEWMRGDTSKQPAPLLSFAVRLGGNDLDMSISDEMREQLGETGFEDRCFVDGDTPDRDALRSIIRKAKERHDGNSPTLKIDAGKGEIAVGLFARPAAAGKRGPTHVQLFLDSIERLIVPSGLRPCRNEDHVIVAVSGQAALFRPVFDAIERGVKTKFGDKRVRVHRVDRFLSGDEREDDSRMKTVVAEGAAIWAKKTAEISELGIPEPPLNDLAQSFALVRGEADAEGFSRIEEIQCISGGPNGKELTLKGNGRLFLVTRPPGLSLAEIMRDGSGAVWTGNESAGEFGRAIVNRVLRPVVPGESPAEPGMDEWNDVEFLIPPDLSVGLLPRDEVQSTATRPTALYEKPPGIEPPPEPVATGPGTFKVVFKLEDGFHTLRVDGTKDEPKPPLVLDDVGAWAI